MVFNGDPIRIGLVATPGATSVSIGLYLPGTNTLYAMLPTDFLFITSLRCTANGEVDLLSAAAGASAVSASTLLASFQSTGYWKEVGSEALSGPQGVLPSVFTPVNTTAVALSGTGFVQHAPAITRPAFLAPLTPTPSSSTTPVVVSNPALINIVPGTLRNDFPGYVGVQITVGAAPITITALGRMNYAGNSLTHGVVLSSTNTPATSFIVSTLINTALGTPGSVQYSTLATPVVIPAGTTLYLTSYETNGGDQWSNNDASVNTTSDFSPTYTAVDTFSATSTLTGLTYGTATGIYVPPDLLYHL